jgi:23S rRNA U2552 (ribose-2'-O)-methylase RlmE/FtsJ
MISDICPNIENIKNINDLETKRIVVLICKLAVKKLDRKGTLLFKLFNDELVHKIIDKLLKIFFLVKVFKLKSSKLRSSEIYILCKNMLFFS